MPSSRCSDRAAARTALGPDRSAGGRVGYLFAVLLWSAALRHYDEAFTAAIMVIFTAAGFVGYLVAMETATRGRSLGKMAMAFGWCPTTAVRSASARPCSGLWRAWSRYGCSLADRR